LTERSRDDKIMQEFKKKTKGEKMEYSKKVEVIRKASGLKRDKFADVIGISLRGYYYILRGEKEPRTLTKRRIDELAKEYGVKDHGDK
jgi:transcriptional regulator with XRE-family HTH domain